jgi:hypothetical protein
MKWKIENERFDATYLMVNTSFDPQNDVLRYSLAQIKKNNYAKFILHQSKSMSYGEEHVSIYNYSDMDWEDKSWAKGVKGGEMEAGEMFLVHDVMGKVIIKESLFDAILFDYGTKLLEVYGEDTNNQEKYKQHWEWYDKNNELYVGFPLWKDAMKNSLNRLKNKIDKV